MRKLLILSTAIFIFVTFFIGKLSSDESTSNENYLTKVVDKDIYITKDNQWEKINIKGVNINGSKPGKFTSDNSVTKDEYLRWINLIYDMGANCIRVPNLLGDNFYKALYEFNEGKDEPIYLMQGIYFDENYLEDGYDIQDIDLKALFKDNIKLIIDSVHGNKYNLKKNDILQSYDTDVSKYVIGYTLGIEFTNNDLIYTEIMNEKGKYNGKYIYTTDDASSAESYLAQMGDYLANYQLETYKTQPLITFIGTSDYHIASIRKNQKDDSYISTELENEGREKDYVDVENIKVKDKLKSGIAVSYNIFPSYSEMKEYKGDMKGYLEEINNYHTIPVIINEFGIPSARVANDFNDNEEKAYITEEEQGKLLAETYRAIKDSNCVGGFIFEFQDSWQRSSWNTKNSRIFDRSVYWSDLQTYSQSFGLMAFDPGKNSSISYPDKSIDEWSNDDITTEEENLSLSTKSDEKYLYLMVKSSDNIDFSKSEISIDLDVTPKSGSNHSSQFNLNFERPVDFIINIKGQEDSSVYVHEYYNEFTFNKNKNKNKQRPDLMQYTHDMDEFSKILMEVRPKVYMESSEEFLDELNYEAGKLVHGDGNPSSENFNSVADFYIGENYVEIRIPWGLLNFMDPSKRQIKDDFYEEFKIRQLQISNIFVGVTIKENDSIVKRLKSESYKLNGWILPKYHERLKESYYILKEELTSN